MNISLKSREFDSITTAFLKNQGVWGEKALDVGARYTQELGAGLWKGLQKFGVEDYTILEIYEPNVKELRQKGYSVIQGDVLEASEIFPKESFDIVLWSHGPEHLSSLQEIHKAMRELEKITRHFLVLSFPVGIERQGPVQGNPYEVHRHFIMDVREITDCFTYQYKVHSHIYNRKTRVVNGKKHPLKPNAVVVYNKLG